MSALSLPLKVKKNNRSKGHEKRMLKPRCSHEVNKPKASRVRACGVSFPPLN